MCDFSQQRTTQVLQRETKHQKVIVDDCRNRRGLRDVKLLWCKSAALQNTMGNISPLKDDMLTIRHLGARWSELMNKD